MGDLSKGETFSDGQEVNASRLNNHVDGATLTTTAITGKQALATPADTDQILIYDASDTALRKVAYSVLRDTILTNAAVENQKKTIAQTAHGFAVGDIIAYNPIIGATAAAYAKAQAKYRNLTFTDTDVNTGSNRITVTSTNAIVDQEKCFLKSTGTLPAPLISGKFYYIKRIDSTTIELYPTAADALAGTNIIDLTDAGTAAATVTLYYNIPWHNQVGVVTTVGSADSFVVTFSGYLTGLSGLTAGRVYFLSTTSGAVTATPPINEGELVVPVYVATSATDAIMPGVIASQLHPRQVHEEHIADKEVTWDKHSEHTRQLLSPGMRQTVLVGRCDSTTGQANFLEPGSGLQVTLKASASNPCLISFANGFDANPKLDYVELLTADKTFDSLQDDYDSFLYAERASTGLLSFGACLTSPEYGFVKSLYRNRACHPFWESASDTVAAHVVSQSSTFGTDFARNAFDGDITSKAALNATTGWWKMEFPFKRIINKYHLTNATSTVHAAATIQFQGSTDNVGWTTIDTQSFTWAAANTKKVFTTTNTTAYKYYRINVTASQPGATRCDMAEIAFYEAVQHYYVIPEAAMYYHDGASWSKKNRVFVGEVQIASGNSSVSSSDLITYALQGLYVTDVTTVAAATDYTFDHNIGTNWLEAVSHLKTAEQFPWSVAWYDPGTTAGPQITFGNSTGHPRQDRYRATVKFRTYVTRTDEKYPAVYSTPASGTTQTIGLYRAIFRRAF